MRERGTRWRFFVRGSFFRPRGRRRLLMRSRNIARLPLLTAPFFTSLRKPTTKIPMSPSDKAISDSLRKVPPISGETSWRLSGSIHSPTLRSGVAFSAVTF